MSKELPYFKFNVAEWLTGDIVYEEFELQGLFINICALYWQRSGNLSIDDINRRYKKPTALLSLTDRFISVNDGLISIDFLDEQFDDQIKRNKTNTINGKKGGRPKATPAEEKKPTALLSVSETKANESNKEKKREEEEKKREDKKIEILNSQVWIEQICMKKRFTIEKTRNELKDFMDDLILKGDFEKDISEIKRHFINWLNLKEQKPQPKQEPIYKHPAKIN